MIDTFFLVGPYFEHFFNCYISTFQIHDQQMIEIKERKTVEISEIDGEIKEKYEAKMKDVLLDLREQYEEQLAENRAQMETLYETKVSLIFAHRSNICSPRDASLSDSYKSVER